MTLPARPQATDWRLEPEKDVEIDGGALVATSADPWLRLVPARAPALRRWIRIRYSTSVFDDPVRPLIRFVVPDRESFPQPMNGAVLGSAEWVGRVPEGTEAVLISPAATPGPFGFRLDSVARVKRRHLVRRGLAYDRRSLMQSLGAKIVRAHEERWETLKFASTATPLKDYAAWHARLSRPLDLDGLDRPRADWRTAPAIRLLMPLRPQDPARLDATLASLSAQVYGRWTLHALASEDTPDALLAAYRQAMASDPRLRELSDGAPPAALAPDLEGRDVAAVIEPGDRLPDYALAVLAETLVRAPQLRLAYGDEDAVARDGTLHSPLLKPDWSPVYFDAAPYLGRLTCVRCADLFGADLPAAASDLVRDEDAVVRRFAGHARPGEIGHVRRILYRRSREPGPATAGAAAVATQWPARAVTVADNALPEATIVIPSRDRADLLGRCIASLRDLTDYPSYQVVIVDNGTVEPAALALLRKLGAEPNVHVIARPGKFNYSALCNDGARVTDTPLLVFLNNDIVVFEPGWLKAMAGWAMQPNVGVAGAKLLFPDNRIEHAGVVLGLGSVANHLYERHPSTEQGYMQRLLVPHETAAVTGACIAIERAKFEAVGGYDAEHLPVDLNDIDLCLKAAERGWHTVWTPEAVLYHHQSASRGNAFKPFTLYRKERTYFRGRWTHVIRDDPYFHPGLSLFSYNPALA